MKPHLGFIDVVPISFLKLSLNYVSIHLVLIYNLAINGFACAVAQEKDCFDLGQRANTASLISISLSNDLSPFEVLGS